MPWTWPKVFPDTSLPLNSGIVCWVPALAGLTVSGLWVFSGSLLPPPCWCSSSGLYSESLALTSISLGVFVLSLRSPLWVSLSWVSPTSCWVVPPNIGVILVVTQMCSMLNSPLLNLGNQEEAYLEPLGRYFHRLGRVVPKWKECGFGVRPGFASWLHCLITLASYLPALSLHSSLFPVWIISMLQGHCENWVVRHCVYVEMIEGFPGGASGKEPTCQCRRHRRCRFDPWVGKIPWRRKRQPTPIFLPGKPHGQRSLASYTP